MGAIAHQPGRRLVYGLRKGYRGRFAMYIPPLLEHLGLVELEYQPRNNRIHAT